MIKGHVIRAYKAHRLSQKWSRKFNLFSVMTGKQNSTETFTTHIRAYVLYLSRIARVLKLRQKSSSLVCDGLLQAQYNFQAYNF